MVKNSYFYDGIHMAGQQTSQQYKDIRDKIESELRCVVQRLAALGADLTFVDTENLLKDWVGFAQGNETKEMNLNTRSHLTERATRLCLALRRINEGRYGTCVRCEDPISLKRLNALPEAITCVSCQEELEQFANGRPRLRRGN